LSRAEGPTDYLKRAAAEAIVSADAQLLILKSSASSVESLSVHA